MSEITRIRTLQKLGDILVCRVATPPSNDSTVELGVPRFDEEAVE